MLKKCQFENSINKLTSFSDRLGIPELRRVHHIEQFPYYFGCDQRNTWVAGSF